MKISTLNLISIQKYAYLINRKYLLWGCIGLLLILYFTLIRNYTNYQINKMNQILVEDQQLLEWINRTFVEINYLNSKPITTKSNNILATSILIENEAKANPWGLLVTGIKKMANEQVEVTFEKISFDDLMDLIEVFWAKYNIQINKISIRSTETKSDVQATLLFQR